MKKKIAKKRARKEEEGKAGANICTTISSLARRQIKSLKLLGYMIFQISYKGQFLTTYESHLKIFSSLHTSSLAIFRLFLSKVADRFKMSEKFASRHAVLKLAMHRKRIRQPNVS